MKIFLTGGTGFIGSHFLSKGLRQGLEIKALKRQASSSTKIGLDTEPLWLIKGFDEVKIQDLEGCEILVHLAAHSANFPYDTLENCIKYNVIEPLRLFAKAKLAGINKFVIAGSCFEFGSSGERYDFIPSNAPMEPTNTYSTSKAMATLAFRNFALENDVFVSIQRIFQVYGLGELETRLWPSLRKAAMQGLDFPMTKGEQVRDFINVEDVSEKLIQICFELSESIKSPHFQLGNIGSGKPQSIYEFSNYWWKKWGAKGELLVGEIPYRSGEVMRFVPKI